MSETLLPANATEAERAMESSIARVSSVPVPARYMWSPQTCPTPLLPWLAWAFSVDEWDTSWTEQQKRAAIAAAYVVQRQKGTIGAVKRALGALGLEISIVEWFQESPPAAPYTFRIALGSGSEGAPQDKLLKLLAVLNSAKNLRSHLRSIDLQVNSTAELFLAAVTMVGSEIEITFPYIPQRLDGSRNLDGSWRLNGIKELHV